MLPGSRRIIAALTLVAVAWACIWCCCTNVYASAGVGESEASLGQCCETPRSAEPCSEGEQGCPHLQIRNGLAQIHPAPVVLPDPVDCFWAVAQTILIHPVCDVAASFDRQAGPPPLVPVTLLSLHTSLLC